MAEQIERTSPSSPEAEKAILAGIILNPMLINEVQRLLPTGEVHTPSYRQILQAMVVLNKQGVGIDPVMVNDQLKRQGVTADWAKVSEVTNLTYGMPHTFSLKHYIDVIRRHAKTRWAIGFAERMADELWTCDKPDDVLEGVLNTLLEVRGEYEQQGSRVPKSLDQMYDDMALRYLMFFRGISNALPTGFPELDKHLLGGGLIPSGFYLLASVPSLGKSTFLIDCCFNIAEAGNRVLVVTKEMSKESMVDRMVAAKANVDRFKVSSGISEKDYEAVMETLAAMRLVPMVLDDSIDSPEELDHYLTQADRDGKRFDMVGLDYLQLMGGDGDQNGRTNQVSGVSRGLKRVAVKHNIPVFAISNLNRQPGDGEPELRHLRESGQLEFDADVVMFLHGDKPLEKREFYTRELLGKKNREGPLFHETMDMNARLITYRTPSMLGHGEMKKAFPSLQHKRPVGGLRERRLANDEHRALTLIDQEQREEPNY